VANIRHAIPRIARQALIVTLFYPGIVGKVSGTPTIVCETPVYEFGVMGNTGTVEHTYTIWNRGDSPLEINRFTSCCGSTARLGSKTIAPGTNTTFHVQLPLKGRQNEVRKAFYLGTNDPLKPYYQLLLRGTAEPVVTNMETYIQVDSGAK